MDWTPPDMRRNGPFFASIIEDPVPFETEGNPGLEGVTRRYDAPIGKMALPAQGPLYLETTGLGPGGNKAAERTEDKNAADSGVDLVRYRSNTDDGWYPNSKVCCSRLVLIQYSKTKKTYFVVKQNICALEDRLTDI